MITSELLAFQFEIFMMKAYKLDKRIRRPSKAEFKNLIRADKQGAFSKEIKILKGRIDQAIEIFFKNDANHEFQEKWSLLQSLNTKAKSSHDLELIIKQGLEITAQFK
ncbi:hypothetical protein [Psychroflexus sp. ALD_RP9]|uniref:hypothetical protein n=1 Tax=Psychroflexus sp. ALD_RP9 TaxID=2777186 RepID=UPI001A8C9E1B|nr:hypothetical protein [Psychroflexus sp. ALD_RP9]QSS96341.1 hypothetical protein IMZ30_07685 [Psychroflexus sp. ALD_RP9]